MGCFGDFGDCFGAVFASLHTGDDFGFPQPLASLKKQFGVFGLFFGLCRLRFSGDSGGFEGFVGGMLGLLPLFCFLVVLAFWDSFLLHV